MGGAVSAGEDNDELIDNLVEAEYIKTPLVERVFRAIDRADYYADGCKENAYRDLAWKHGNLHLSAPCIYSEVMEYLQLVPGLSFLNLGSGTGYLSTMVGLIIGPYGVNHGVEIYRDVVDYAKMKLEEFKSMSSALDEYEFCPPTFIRGNCLLLNNTDCRQYDRVYCGASCPQEYENYMKNLIRIGGILVMPLNDHLFQIIRTSETTWEMKSILPVSFASLILPSPEEALESVNLPESSPLTLQEICRSIVRALLRENINRENPTLESKTKRRNPKRKRDHQPVKQIVIPLFEESFEGTFNVRAEESDEEDEYSSGLSSKVLTHDSRVNSSSNVVVIDESDSDKFFPPLETERKEADVQTTSAFPHLMTSNACEMGDSSSRKTEGDCNTDTYLSDAEIFELDTNTENLPENLFHKLPERKDNADIETKENSSDSLHAHHSACDNSREFHHKQSTVLLKHVGLDDMDSEESNSSKDDETNKFVDEAYSQNSYSYLMRQKISVLPLPWTLKFYLNYQRPL